MTEYRLVNPNHVIQILTRYVKHPISATTVAASSSVSDSREIPLGLPYLGVTARVIYDASATAGATLNIYGSPDGTNYDTDPLLSVALPFTAGATVQKTISLSIPTPYVKVELVNNDGTYSLTADIWEVFY